MEPKLAAFRDKVVQNEKLFKRVAAIYETREKSGLDAGKKQMQPLREIRMAGFLALIDFLLGQLLFAGETFPTRTIFLSRDDHDRWRGSALEVIGRGRESTDRWSRSGRRSRA